MIIYRGVYQLVRLPHLGCGGWGIVLLHPEVIDVKLLARSNHCTIERLTKCLTSSLKSSSISIGRMGGLGPSGWGFESLLLD